jgi:hypothetical protein
MRLGPVAKPITTWMRSGASTRSPQCVAQWFAREIVQHLGFFDRIRVP